MDFLKKLFGFEQKYIVGMDIGAYYIKWAVAQAVAKRDKTEIRVKAMGYTESVPITNKEAIVEKLMDIFRENNLDPQKYYPVVSISGSQIIVRPVRIKRREGISDEDLVYEEAQKYIPYDITEARVVHHVLEPQLEDDPESMEVLIIAAPLELINTIEEILDMAELNREAIEVDMVAIWRLLAALNLEDFSSGTVAVMDVGAFSTGITIYANGKLRHARTLSIGGDAFTSKLIDNLGLSPDSAEEYKRKYGYLKVEGEEPESAEQAKVAVIFKDVVDNLVKELKRTFMYYKLRYKGSEIERILITGGGSLIRNFDRYLQQSLNVAVERFNPIDYCHLPGRIRKELPKEMGTLFPIAIGLAIRKPSQ